MREDLQYLTGPETAGRLSGTEGARRASAYLADSLAALGLAPVGEDGYFQWLAVPAARLTGPPRLSVAGQRYRHRRDFAEATHLAAGGSVTAPLIVVNEQDLLRPDDLAGKVVLIAKRPANLDLNATVQAAADLKVAAVLVEWGEPSWFHKTLFGTPSSRIPVLRIRESVAAALAANPGAEVELELPLTVGPLPCRNVLGLLPGTDPAWTVVLTAHYDHVGDDPGGGRFPGAMDNASGVVTLLEVMRRLVHSRVTLPFSVLVGFLTGEESGLHGARHLAAHPPAPLSAVINLDGMGSEPSLRAIRLGYAASGPWIADMAAAVFREKGIAIRWTAGGDDAAAFQAAGLPALGLGQMPTEPGTAGLHSPDDTIERLHLPTVAEGAEAILSLLRRLAVHPAVASQTTEMR